MLWLLGIRRKLASLEYIPFLQDNHKGTTPNIWQLTRETFVKDDGHSGEEMKDRAVCVAAASSKHQKAMMVQGLECSITS